MDLAQALPFLIALVVAVGLTAPVLRSLTKAGLERENHRGRRLPLPAGVAVVASALLALIPLAAINELTTWAVYPDDLRAVLTYALGVAFLGLFDDVLEAEPRGWRGHGAAVLRGGLSSGALKAAGSLGLAMFALSGQESLGEYALGVAVLVLSTNLFNLLDLRPGRSVKVFVLLGLGLTLGTLDLSPPAALGLFLGPVLIVGLYDLRERAMLGDTGSNLVGALAGLWIVLALDPLGQLIALLFLVAITLYGEFRSISALVESNPPLRRLDSLGRPR